MGKRSSGSKNGGQVWKVVNKGRKMSRRVSEGMGIREWDEYFRGLLVRTERVSWKGKK